jgi:hypothetical protein
LADKIKHLEKRTVETSAPCFLLPKRTERKISHAYFECIFSEPLTKEVRTLDYFIIF